MFQQANLQEEADPRAHLGRAQILQVAVRDDRAHDQRVAVSEGRARLAARRELEPALAVGRDEVEAGQPLDRLAPRRLELLTDTQELLHDLPELLDHYVCPARDRYVQAQHLPDA